MRMEELFAYEYGTVKTNQSNTNDNRADSIFLDRTATVSVPGLNAGTVQQYSGILYDTWKRHCAKHGFDIRIADAGILGRNDENDGQGQSVSGTENNGREYEINPIFSRGRIIESDEPFERDDAYRTEEDEGRAESTGFDTVETQAEMDSDWCDIAVNTAYLAADLAMIGGGENDEKLDKKKFVRERKHGQKKKNQEEQSQDNGFEMSM